MSAMRKATAGGGKSGRTFDLGAVLIAGRAYIALVLIVVAFSIMSPHYFTPDNLLVMTRHVAVNAILSIGMLIVILSGGIDLSIGSTVGLTGVVAGYLLQGVKLPGLSSLLYPAVWVVVVLSILVGALVGLVNGVLVARFKVPPFVTTLGMLYVARGIALLITGGQTYPKLDGNKAYGNTGFRHVGYDSIFGIPTGVYLMIIVALVAGYVLRSTPFGRWLYAAGGNERAAELSGVRVKMVKTWVYVIAGACAAVTGLVIASELTTALPNTGTSYELTAIAAVVIGGAALTGGRGTVRGTLLGAFVIGFLSDGLVIVGVSEYWQQVIKGAVIVAAVLLDQLQQRTRRKPAGSAPGSPALVAPTASRVETDGTIPAVSEAGAR